MKWFHLFSLKPISKLLGFLFSKNGATFSIGVATHFAINLFVNGFIAGYVTFHLSLLWSLLSLFFINILKVIIMVKIYDRFEKDVFGIETFKSGQIDERKVVRMVKKILHHLNRRGKFFTHVTLIVIDHFFGVVYIRREHRVYRGIPRQDWLAILLAMVISTPVIVFGWEILIKIYWILHSLYIQIGPKGTFLASVIILIFIFLIKRFKKHNRSQN